MRDVNVKSLILELRVDKMEFNKEEINLCLQISRWYKKPIKEGDWVVHFWKDRQREEPWVFSVDHIEEHFKTDEPLCIKEWDGDHKMMSMDFDEVTPLWTLSECLKFIREKGYRVKLDEELKDDPFNVACYGHKSKKAFHTYGKTDLATCLRAIVAIFKGG